MVQPSLADHLGKLLERLRYALSRPTERWVVDDLLRALLRLLCGPASSAGEARDVFRLRGGFPLLAPLLSVDGHSHAHAPSPAIHELVSVSAPLQLLAVEIVGAACVGTPANREAAKGVGLVGAVAHFLHGTLERVAAATEGEAVSAMVCAQCSGAALALTQACEGEDVSGAPVAEEVVPLVDTVAAVLLQGGSAAARLDPARVDQLRQVKLPGDVVAHLVAVVAEQRMVAEQDAATALAVDLAVAHALEAEFDEEEAAAHALLLEQQQAAAAAAAAAAADAAPSPLSGLRPVNLQVILVIDNADVICYYATLGLPVHRQAQGVLGRAVQALGGGGGGGGGLDLWAGLAEPEQPDLLSITVHAWLASIASSAGSRLMHAHRCPSALRLQVPAARWRRAPCAYTLPARSATDNFEFDSLYH